MGGLTAEQIEAIYKQEGLRPYRWGNGPRDTYGEHSHSYHKVLYCIEGTIVFTVDGEDVEMQPGDRLDLEPGTPHSAVVGISGVTCAEAMR